MKIETVANISNHQFGLLFSQEEMFSNLYSEVQCVCHNVITRTETDI